MEHEMGKTLDKENRFGPYFADAYDPETRTVYEFNGCCVHGYPSCYPDLVLQQNEGYPNTTGDLPKATLEKQAYHKRQGIQDHQHLGI